MLPTPNNWDLQFYFYCCYTVDIIMHKYLGNQISAVLVFKENEISNQGVKQANYTIRFMGISISTMHSLWFIMHIYFVIKITK